MKKIIFCLLLIATGSRSFSQVELVYFLPKGEDKFSIGFGASLKFSKQVSDAGAVTLEVAADFASITQTSFEQGIALVPVKLGFRYILSKDTYGFYVEPQVGYNVYGAFTNDNVDTKINGLELAGGVGYLFPSAKRSQYDIGIRFESSFSKQGTFNFVGLKLSRSFSFGRRDE